MAADVLARRLLHLRQHHWDSSITQPALGRLLGVKAPTISSWERAEAVPPQERLIAYATLFASRRSLDLDRLLDEAELEEAERAERAGLLSELTELREEALGRVDARDPDLLAFDDDAPVRIICGYLEDRPKTARGRRWNYMALSAYADLDALLELHGHLRARNPRADVRAKLAGRLEGHDLHADLMLLGSLAATQTDLRQLMPPLPVHQVPDDDAPDGEIFIVPELNRRFGPQFTGEQGERRVVEDIGLIARMTNPLDSARTVTIFSGVYTRGVYGAVRALTDRQIGPLNARWLRNRFADSSVFGVLMRVRGTDHAISTPRLSDPDVCVYEFSTA